MAQGSNGKPPAASAWVFGGLVLVNILTIGWVFTQGFFTTNVQDVQSYSVYRELETNGIVDVEKLETLRDGAYADGLHLFTTDELTRYTDRVRWTSGVVLIVMALNVIALFVLRRRARADHFPKLKFSDS